MLAREQAAVEAGGATAGGPFPWGENLMQWMQVPPRAPQAMPATVISWTILPQDGPNHLGLWHSALHEHQMALITCDLAGGRARGARARDGRGDARGRGGAAAAAAGGRGGERAGERRGGRGPAGHRLPGVFGRLLGGADCRADAVRPPLSRRMHRHVVPGRIPHFRTEAQQRCGANR